MSDHPVIDAELRARIEGLEEGGSLDVLVYPFVPRESDIDLLIATLERQGLRDGVDYRRLDLAGCVVVRASREVIEDLAQQSAVRRIVANPSVTALGSP
jgi:hypothetical protein